MPTGITYAVGEPLHPVVVHVEGRLATVDAGLARDAAAIALSLVVEHLVAMVDHELERRVRDRVLGQERAQATAGVGRRPGQAAVRVRLVAHLDRGAVEADVLCVHRRVERAPVVPALGDRRAGGTAAGTGPAGAEGQRIGTVGAPVVDRPRDVQPDRSHGGLVEVDARLVPLEPQVVLDARVVRLGRRLDQSRGDVAVVVEHLDRQPLLHLGHGRPYLGLRLGQEVAVEVEAVAVRPGTGHAAVRVLDHVEDENDVVEDVVELRIHAVGRRGELLDDLHVRLDALVLVPVNRALDVDRDLDVVAPRVQELLRARGILERDASELVPAVGVADLLRRLPRVEHDAVERPAERRVTDDLDRHPVAELRRLDLVERAADRVVRDVREAARRVGRQRPVRQIPGRVGLGCAAPRRRELRPCVPYQRKRERERGECEEHKSSETACQRRAPPWTGGQRHHVIKGSNAHSCPAFAPNPVRHPCCRRKQAPH